MNMTYFSGTLAGLLFIASPSAQAFNNLDPEIGPGEELEFLITAVGTTKSGEPDLKNIIVCNLFMHHPHNSHHVPGTVNASATAECSGAVPYIELNVGISRDGVLLGGNQFFINNGSRVVGNSAAVCVPGVYRSVAVVSIMWPAGYNPQQGTGNGLSSAIPITC